MIVDGDLKSAVGPRDVTDLVEALGFECHLIGGGTGDIDLDVGVVVTIIVVVVFLSLLIECYFCTNHQMSDMIENSTMRSLE